MKRSILIRSKTLHGPLAKGAAGICLRAMIPCTFHRNSSTTAMDKNENLCKHKADIVGRFGRYNVEYEESIKHPERYWLRAASGETMEKNGCSNQHSIIKNHRSTFLL